MLQTVDVGERSLDADASVAPGPILEGSKSSRPIDRWKNPLGAIAASGSKGWCATRPFTGSSDR